ncbi:nodal homolog [Rhinophrynus dorsalis]
MMQLYQTLILGNDTDLSILEYPVLQESDAVLSLIAKSCTVVGNHWTLSFDMSSISSSNELKLAELRIRLPSFEMSHDVTVEIYHTKEGQEKLFMGSFKTNPSVTMGSSWKVFNLTKMLQYYLHQGDKFTNGEFIEVKDMQERGHESNITGPMSEKGDAVQRNNDHAPVSYLPTERVVLVVFARDKPTANYFGSPSLIQTVESSKYVMSEKPVRVVDTRRHKRNRKAKSSIVVNTIPSRPVGKTLCRRVDMIVDFDKIEWGNRIVYPKRFNAYRCEGACPIPLNETFKPTNHAYIKSLVKLYDNDRTDCSFCAPVKMSPLSMLLYEEDEVVLKHHEDMIVDDCGWLPTLFERMETRIPLPGSNLALKALNSFHGNRHSMGIKYPTYMMQLYHNLLMGNNSSLANLEHTTQKEYDTVLSIFAKNCTELDNQWTMSFDMSSIISSNELRLAELRIRLPSFQKSKNVTVEIYHTKDGQKNFFLGSFKTDPSITPGSSWKVFNVTKILQYYLQKKEQNAKSELIKPKVMPESDLGMDSTVFFTDAGHKPQQNADNAPVSHITKDSVMLVVFTKDKSSNNPFGSPSLIKTAESSKYVMMEKARVAGIRRHRRNRNEKHHILMGNIPSRPVEYGKSLCRRVDMIVDFEDVGWSNWIVYPKKYNAYRCEGACPIPLNETFKPTNHAYMTSVVKFYQPERVECPSCVPIKMSPLSMLYYEGDEVVLRHHEEMIVEDCGCS